MAYLDAGTTQRLNAAGRIALLSALDNGWGDPVRLHREGRRAQVMIDDARATIAQILTVRADELWLVGSGTAAVHVGISGLARGRLRAPGPVVHSAVEHSSVIDAAAACAGAATDSATEGSGVHVVPVDGDGLIDLDELRRALTTTGARLVAVQSVNQETGVAQPLDEVADLCLTHDVPLLVDAAQGLGREPLPPAWDVLTGSAHKWGGPAGVGVLTIRTGQRWRATDQVHALDRPSLGFPDVPSAVAAAAALVQAEEERSTQRDRLMRLTARIRAVAATIPDVAVVGHPDRRAAHLVTFSCLYVAGEAIVDALDREGFSVASGSACSSDALGPSHVLAAMGVLTHGNVRIGLPADVADDDVERLLQALPVAVSRIRSAAGVDRL